MGRELIVAWAGRHRRDDWDRLCGRYRERISAHLPVRELAVRVLAKGEGRERLEAEGRELVAALPDPCWIVALTRQGRARSSPELAHWLGELLDRWPHPIAFLVGSDLGLGRSALVAARERLSLGPGTLPHELARLVLYEQLYRSLSLKVGIKYHRLPL
jgi:23S rRNA (pseudouridine1915-N3)-methyltransferase